MSSEPREHPPREAKLQAVLSFVAVTALGGWIGFQWIASYGWTAFVVAPFVSSAIAAIVLNSASPLTRASDCFVVSAQGLIICLVTMIFIRYEGLLCVGMAFPLLLLQVWMGSSIGHSLSKVYRDRSRLMALPIFLIVPASHLLESRYGVVPFEDVVTTRMVIHATPAQIWPHLLNLQLPPPDEFLFRNGVAHPVSTRTRGTHRECVLSTGVMNEEIIAFEPGRRLAFRVLNTPPSMKEMNPFGDVHAAHLVGYYTCQTGEFRLTPLADGTTLIEGTSRYRCRIAPAAYWELWTRKIVHDVHLRVFREIARETEGS